MQLMMRIPGARDIPSGTTFQCHEMIVDASVKGHGCSRWSHKEAHEGNSGCLFIIIMTERESQGKTFRRRIKTTITDRDKGGGLLGWGRLSRRMQRNAEDAPPRPHRRYIKKGADRWVAIGADEHSFVYQ